MITIIAFITMFIDHLGFFVFPDLEILRIIGRISFPLFAFGIIRGFSFTSNKINYAKRILILAIFSQIPFIILGLNIYNVCFNLLFGLIALIVLEEKKIDNVLKIAFIGLLAFISQSLHFDYGAYGFFMIILFYLFYPKKILIFYYFILTFAFYFIDYKNLDVNFSIQIYSILSLFLIYFTPILKYDFKINKTFKYLFYPVHFIFIYIIGIYLDKLHFLNLSF